MSAAENVANVLTVEHLKEEMADDLFSALKESQST